MNFFRKLIGRFRLWHGYCPACNSDAPALYTCPICNGDRELFYRLRRLGLYSLYSKVEVEDIRKNIWERFYAAMTENK